MVDQSAVNMVKQKLNQGMAESQVKSILESAGYTKPEIAEIMVAAHVSRPEQAPVQQQRTLPMPVAYSAGPSAGGPSVPSKIIHLFLNFWISPRKMVNDIVEEKGYVIPIIMLIMMLVVSFGIGKFMYGDIGKSSYGINSYMMQAISNPINSINPASYAVMGYMIPDVLYGFLLTGLMLLAPLLGFIFIATMLTKAVVDTHTRFRDVARSLSIPYSLVSIYGSLLGLIVFGMMKIREPGILGVFMLAFYVMFSFLAMFISLYAYVLYGLMIKEKYNTSLAFGVGVFILFAIVLSLFTLSITMLYWTMGMMGSSSMFF